MRILLAFLLSCLIACQPKSPPPPLEVSAEKNIWKMQTLTSQCTSFQIDKELIVTAAHCAHSQLFLFKNGPDTLEGKLVGLSEESDIAVFFVPGADRPGFPVGENPPAPGEELVAIGFPARVTDSYVFVPVRIAGLARSPDGSIFARTMGPSVWPGMSGGPLVNSRGEVVGVVSSTGQIFFGPENDPTSLMREAGNFSVDLMKTVTDIIAAANRRAYENGESEEEPETSGTSE